VALMVHRWKNYGMPTTFKYVEFSFFYLLDSICKFLLRRVLNNAGAIQLNAIVNDGSKLHVIVGERMVEEDWMQLLELDIKPFVVTLQWLIQSLQLKAPAPEIEFSEWNIWCPTDFENLITLCFSEDTPSELPLVTTSVSQDDVRTTVQYYFMLAMCAI
jgi:hypothetical protein